MSLHLPGFQTTFTDVFVCSHFLVPITNLDMKNCPVIQNVSEGCSPCSPGSQTANLQKHLYKTFDNTIILWFGIL